MSDYRNDVEELETKSATAARLFDVRRIIGGLFVLYGIIVTIAGITASDADLKKAQDININLWTGLGMLALGLFFLVWLKLSPTKSAPSADPSDAPGDTSTPTAGTSAAASAPSGPATGTSGTAADTSGAAGDAPDRSAG